MFESDYGFLLCCFLGFFSQNSATEWSLEALRGEHKIVSIAHLLSNLYARHAKRRIEFVARSPCLPLFQKKRTPPKRGSLFSGVRL